MIEQVARTSAEQLRATTVGDVEAGLADLHVRQERHHRRTAVGVLAAAVVAVGLGWTGGAVLTHQVHAAPGPSRPGPSQGQVDPQCRSVEPMTCLGHHTYRFPLTRPVQWRIPAGFGVGSGFDLPLMVESYREDGQGGVTVMEGVRASTPDGTRPAPGVAESPRAFVRWVASRPFLTAGPVHTTSVDGRRAWQVRVALLPGLGRGPATCNRRSRCYAITYQGNGLDAGVFGDEAAEYTAFRLPGAGTTVVWSWRFGSEMAHLGALDVAVRGLTWPGG